MYFSLIAIFLLLLGIAIAGFQNSVLLDLKFITWNFQISSTALTIFSSMAGGAIVAILALPELAMRSLDDRRSRKQIAKLKETISAHEN
jgi:uncharacterized integral membrane protein